MLVKILKLMATMPRIIRPRGRMFRWGQIIRPQDGYSGGRADILPSMPDIPVPPQHGVVSPARHVYTRHRYRSASPPPASPQPSSSAPDEIENGYGSSGSSGESDNDAPDEIENGAGSSGSSRESDASLSSPI